MREYSFEVAAHVTFATVVKAASIEEAVAEAEKRKEATDKDELEAAVKALNEAIMPIGAKMYQQSAEAEAPVEGDDADKKKTKKDDDAVEGEVVDEK